MPTDSRKDLIAQLLALLSETGSSPGGANYFEKEENLKKLSDEDLRSFIAKLVGVKVKMKDISILNEEREKLLDEYRSETEKDLADILSKWEAENEKIPKRKPGDPGYKEWTEEELGKLIDEISKGK